MFLAFEEREEKEKHLLLCLDVEGKKNERKINKKKNFVYYFIPINYKLIFNYENIVVISQNICVYKYKSNFVDLEGMKKIKDW